MADKKDRKFLTSIIIGGALGSIAALIFGGKKREGQAKRGFFSRMFGKKSSHE